MSKKLANLVPLFEALGDENRLKILAYTKKRTLRCKLGKKGECEDQTCIKDLEKELDISLPTISYHVKTLVIAGLLDYRKDGKFSYLEVKPEKFKAINDFIKIFNS